MSDPNYMIGIGVATGNLNDNNFIDIAMVYDWGVEEIKGGVAIWRGFGNGNFYENPATEPTRFYVDPNSTGYPFAHPMYVRVADLNQDGRMDLAVTCQGTGKLSVRLNTLGQEP